MSFDSSAWLPGANLPSTFHTLHSAEMASKQGSDEKKKRPSDASKKKKTAKEYQQESKAIFASEHKEHSKAWWRDITARDEFWRTLAKRAGPVWETKRQLTRKQYEEAEYEPSEDDEESDEEPPEKKKKTTKETEADQRAGYGIERCADCGERDNKTKGDIKLFSCHVYHSGCLARRIELAQHDTNLQFCALPSCSRNLYQTWKAHFFPPADKDGEAEDTSEDDNGPLSNVNNPIQPAQETPNTTRNPDFPSQQSKEVTPESAPGADSSAKPALVSVAIKKLPADLASVLTSDDIPADSQLTILQAHKPRAQAKPTATDLLSRRQSILSRAGDFNLSPDDAKKMIFGPDPDGSKLVVELEACINEYPQWTMIQVYRALSDLHGQMVIALESGSEIELPAKKSFDSDIDSQVIGCVQDLAFGDTTIGLGRLVKARGFLNTHKVVEEQDRKVGKSIYDRFIEGELAHKKTGVTESREVIRRRYERANGVGGKLSLFVKEFGPAIILVIPPYLNAESLAKYSTAKCKMLLHCLRNGPDAERLTAFCQFSKPKMEEILNVRASDVGAAAKNVKDILLNVSMTTILPARIVEIGRDGDPIREALNLTPDFETTLVVGDNEIRIEKQNLRHLSYGQWLDDTVISVVLRLCELRFGAEMDIVDTLSFQFQDGKLPFGEPNWIGRLRSNVIIPVPISYSKAKEQGNNHWMLAVVNKDQARLSILDSLNDEDQCRLVARAIQSVWRNHSAEHVHLSWTFELSAEQENSDDCGIFLLLNAIWALHGQRLPTGRVIDTCYVRRTFFLEIDKLVKAAQAKEKQAGSEE